MSEPTDSEVGANLAELYLKGRDTLPGVAAEIASARSELVGAETSGFYRPSDEFYQNPAIAVYGHGFSSASPAPEFEAAISALSGHLSSLHEVLAACGPNIIVTAQDYARTDADIRAAFQAHGGKL